MDDRGHPGRCKQSWTRFLILALFTVPFVLPQQKGPVHIGGMSLSDKIARDSVDISLTAPTTGWVGIGFNDEKTLLEVTYCCFMS